MNKIIDFHTHVCYEKCYNDIMHKKNITTAICIPFELPIEKSNKDLVQIAGMTPKPLWCQTMLQFSSFVNEQWYQSISNQSQFIFVPWISILTDISKIKHTTWFQMSQIVKFIPVFDHVESIDIYVTKLSEMIEQLPQHIIMIHTGWGSSPRIWKSLIQNHPHKIFILAHLKEDTDDDNIARQEIMKLPNVYFEISYLSSPKRIEQYVKVFRFGNKLLFGSDWRSNADTCTLNWFINAIKLCPISQSEREKIFYTNAHELLNSIGIHVV